MLPLWLDPGEIEVSIALLGHDAGRSDVLGGAIFYFQAPRRSGRKRFQGHEQDEVMRGLSARFVTESQETS
jgi:hypothetical protein